jgi:cytochrome c oxidase subunit 2
MENRTILILAVLFILIGFIGLFAFNFYTFAPKSGKDRSVRSPFPSVRTDSFRSNGEQIFMTGLSRRGSIRVTGGPFWFQMHGGGCATCHGSDGRGGRVIMMGVLEAPSITYKDLTREEHEEEGEEEHPPYTDALIKRAITKGINPAGERLDSEMPRWDLSDADFKDLLRFLKKLDP